MASVVGAALIVLGMWDIFHTLFHPHGRGGLSSSLTLMVWRVLRRVAKARSGLLTLAGPVAMLTVLASWVALFLVGWALIYWPHLPEKFQLTTGLSPEGNDGLWTALYLSSVTLATLGYGDIVPTAGPLRMLAPAQAFVGFGLITAGLSWVLSVYPVLSRKRSLAHELLLLRAAADETKLDVAKMDSSALASLVSGITKQLVVARGDLLQWPVSFYFHPNDERSALPAALPYLAAFAQDLQAAESTEEVRLHAKILRSALDDLLQVVGQQPAISKPDASPEAILAAYGEEHLRAAGERKAGFA